MGLRNVNRMRILTGDGFAGCKNTVRLLFALSLDNLSADDGLGNGVERTNGHGTSLNQRREKKPNELSIFCLNSLYPHAFWLREYDLPNEIIY